MKKMGKVFAFSILALLAFSFVASIVVAADNGQPATGSAKTDVVTPPTEQTTTNALKEFINWWKSSSFKISDTTKGLIAKLLLFFLVVLMVYSIFSFIPIFPNKNSWIPWTVSIIVGLLAFLFISADTIKYIQTNYEALGVVLTSILPLIIIMTFTLQIRKSSIPAAGFINKLIIIGFIIYSLFKWMTVDIIITQNSSFPELAYIYPLTILVAVIWLIVEPYIWKWYSREEVLEIVQRAKKRGSLAVARERSEAAQEVALGRTEPAQEVALGRTEPANEDGESIV